MTPDQVTEMLSRLDTVETCAIFLCMFKIMETMFRPWRIK